MPTFTDTRPERVIDLLAVHEPSVGVRPCVPSSEVSEGDTLYASGFVSGCCRKVLEVRFGVEHGERRMWVRVAEGWYRWQHVYAHIAQF